MSYEELAAHAATIKQLAIDKTIDLGIQATAGAAAYGGTPPIGYLEDMANQLFGDTDRIFDDWVGLPDPYLLKGGLGNIASAASMLSAGSYMTDDNAHALAGGNGSTMNISQVEPTGAFMQGWTSGTALSYADFAGRFGPVVANLSLCASVLRGASEAEVAIWTEARASVDELAHATIDALEHCTDKSPEDVKFALTVLGAVSGIVAVPFTAGGSLVASYSFAAIAAASSLGGEFVPDETERDGSIQGNTPSEIVSSLLTRLGELNQDIAAKESKVSEALTDSAAAFRSALADPPGTSLVRIPRPSVADQGTFGDHA